VTQQAVNSAPLGLNGDTSHPAKPVRTAAAGEGKRRLAEEPKAPAKELKANPGTPGADTAETQNAKATPAPAKKRHKLLGVL
jgi:hypothetical protein